MKCNKYILWPLSVNRHGGDVMSRTALCAFWGTYGCMTAIAAEVTYTWKLQNLWCWSKREKKKQRLHLAQSERKALQPCCFATKASSRRRSACGGLQNQSFLAFLWVKGYILPMSCCLFGLCSHWNIYQYLSIGVPALFLKLLLTAKREVSLSRPHQQKLSFWKSASALRMLEHLPRKASFARRCLFFKMMLMGLSLDARIPWNTHVCNKHKVKVGCFK